jgi:CBS domain containing-hemolysin-like protein
MLQGTASLAVVVMNAFFVAAEFSIVKDARTRSQNSRLSG